MSCRADSEADLEKYVLRTSNFTFTSYFLGFSAYFYFYSYFQDIENLLLLLLLVLQEIENLVLLLLLVLQTHQKFDTFTSTRTSRV